MVTSDEAVPCGTQFEKPCGDCPFRRDAIPGWLGTMSPEQWLLAVHGEARIDCHAHIGPQCAGAAIYRANMAKRPRDASLLRLAADRDTVFASPSEFKEYHDMKEPR